ncbi:MAG: hypothetical protein MHM6MM_005400 [Cercozoa sp. M6MM]
MAMLRELRCDAVCAHVCERFSPNHALLIRLLLDDVPLQCMHLPRDLVPRGVENQTCWGSEVPYRSIEYLQKKYAMLMKDSNKPNAKITRDQITEYLMELLEDNVPAVAIAEDSSGLARWRVDADGVVAQLRLMRCQEVYRRKYGREGARLFRVLLDKRMLEQKQLQQCALVARQTTRMLLYRMKSDGMALLQELPKTSDRDPTRTLHLWRVPLDQIVEDMRFRLYEAWTHMTNRLALEYKEAREVIDRAHQIMERFHDESVLHDEMSNEDLTRLQAWRRARDRLELATTRLMHDILLFRDF